MLPNVLPVEASHSSLDIFERPPLLITFNTSFEQKIGPVYAPNGPTLEFEVVGDRTNFIDLQNIYLEVKCRIVRPNGDKLQYDAGNAAATDAPFLVNNTLHSLFSECSITANGIKISSANGNYAQKAFIETEFSHNKEAKDTWLKCQGYSYEQQPDDFTKTVFTTRTAETRESAEISFIGRIASDFFSCDKHLISGVTLRISFLRNRPEYALIYDDETKDYKIEILQANLYVRKMTVSDQRLLSYWDYINQNPCSLPLYWDHTQNVSHFHRGAELESRRCIHQGAHSKVCNSYGNKRGLSGSQARKSFPFPKIQSQQHYSLSKRLSCCRNSTPNREW